MNVELEHAVQRHIVMNDALLMIRGVKKSSALRYEVKPPLRSHRLRPLH